MNFNHFTNTDVGQKRQANEDAHGDQMTVNGYVFVVCDGMGGHVGGATASQMAVASILEFFDKEPLENIILGIDKAIKFANEQIFATALAQPELKGMGTTATIVVMREEGAYIGHVGDSRIYVKSDGKLNRLTKDHSFVQGLVDQGIIRDDEAESHPQKNQILKALGIREDVDATVCDSPLQLKVGDTLLLCSDGLSGLVTDSRMEELVNENNVQQSAVDLINEANQNGGTDNITASVVSITESSFTESVFKHFNPVVNTEAAAFNATMEVDIKPKWYQNTKLMILSGASLLIAIVFVSYMLWPDKKVETEPKAKQEKTSYITLDSTYNIKIQLDEDSLKSLKDSSYVLINSLTKKKLDKDSTYFSKDSLFVVTIGLTGLIEKIVSLEEYNANGVINPPPSSPQIKGKDTDTEAEEEEENKEPESDNDKEEEEEEEEENTMEIPDDKIDNSETLTYVVKKGQGWFAIEKATKNNKADLIKLNGKTNDWDPKEGETIYYKKQK